MRSALLEADESGNFVGSSYSYATARDWARFGLFYLDDGISQQERILPEGWVRQSTEPASSAKKGEYGFQFWLNAGRDSIPPKYPHAPRDMYFADGFENQHVFIIPSKKIVIIRLGLTQHHNFDGDQFLREILSAVQ
jgi:CubicO group peptidase (beta-lactamase class C family)